MEVKNKKIRDYVMSNRLLVEDVVNDFSNYIYTIARNSSMYLSDEDIEEIIMDVVFNVWKNLNKLDINKRMSPYVAGITKNLIKKKCRDEKILDNIDDYEEKLINFNDIEIKLIEEEKNKGILEQIEKLKDEDKNIFIQYYYEEKSINQISESMSMSNSKIKSKLFRIRKMLKKHLEKGGYSSNDK